jgi:hypothetical protein|tara:strand:+ start:41 stop:514 length:474 start_codon:yes stop_codon:yes gene_type:complete
MSQQGTRAFYQITETIKTQLLEDVNVNTVTFGNITDIDLSKQTMFPLSHIVVNNVSLDSKVVSFNVTVLSMDIVNQSKDEVVDVFRGNNNEQDILNSQLEVQNRLVSELKRGDLFTDQYQLQGTPSTEPFTDRFEHLVAGWALTFDIITANDISVCD